MGYQTATFDDTTFLPKMNHSAISKYLKFLPLRLETQKSRLDDYNPEDTEKGILFTQAF